MTLRTTGEQSTTTTPLLTTFNMSGTNPNIKAMAAGSKTAGGFKTVYVGKDQRPVSILEVAPLTAPVWKRGSTFDHLATVMRNLSETHDTADIMTTIANEVPISTETAAAEAEEIAARVRKQVFCVDNLSGTRFMFGDGKKVTNMTDGGLDSRPNDIAYFGFQCMLNATESVDERITQEPLNLHYSLKLPQSMYNPETKQVEEIFSTPGKRDRALLTQGMGRLFSTPVRRINFETVTDKDGNDNDKEDEGETKEPGEATNSITSQVITSPKMSRLLSSGEKGSNNNRIGYYGPLTFLDNQSEFAITFGVKPHMLPINPTSTGKNEVQMMLREYAEKCKFDIFLEACRDFYVGANAKDSSAKAVHEICKSITSLNQMYYEKGRQVSDTPDVLFGKFVNMASSLPNDATLWSITLCSQFVNSLAVDLRDEMEALQFRMPSLSGQETKKLQLRALQEVRDYAANAYKSLSERANLVKRMIHQQGGSSKNTRSNIYAYSAEEQNPGNGTSASLLLYNNNSQAEETIAKHRGGDQDAPNPLQLPLRAGPGGLMFPYNPEEPEYLSIYQVGFRGCFQCGQTGHYDRKDCTSKNSNLFWKELWIHKPHTKRKVSYTHHFVHRFSI